MATRFSKRGAAPKVDRPCFVANLDTHSAADVLGVSPRTLQRWRQEGRGPRFLKLGGAVRYPATELSAFANAGLRESTGETPP
jgi:hypothetical protein